MKNKRMRQEGPLATQRHIWRAISTLKWCRRTWRIAGEQMANWTDYLLLSQAFNWIKLTLRDMPFYNGFICGQIPHLRTFYGKHMVQETLSIITSCPKQTGNSKKAMWKDFSKCKKVLQLFQTVLENYFSLYHPPGQKASYEIHISSTRKNYGEFLHRPAQENVCVKSAKIARWTLLCFLSIEQNIEIIDILRSLHFLSPEVVN